MVGQLRPCGIYEDAYAREDGAPFDTRRDRLVDVWRSGAAEALREDFLAGRSGKEFRGSDDFVSGEERRKSTGSSAA